MDTNLIILIWLGMITITVIILVYKLGKLEGMVKK